MRQLSWSHHYLPLAPPMKTELYHRIVWSEQPLHFPLDCWFGYIQRHPQQQKCSKAESRYTSSWTLLRITLCLKSRLYIEITGAKPVVFCLPLLSATIKIYKPGAAVGNIIGQSEMRKPQCFKTSATAAILLSPAERPGRVQIRSRGDLIHMNLLRRWRRTTA